MDWGRKVQGGYWWVSLNVIYTLEQNIQDRQDVVQSLQKLSLPLYVRQYDTADDGNFKKLGTTLPHVAFYMSMNIRKA